MDQESLNKMIADHKLWLEDNGGERFKYDGDLRYAALRHAALRHADLRQAALSNANLRFANLRQADLRQADLRHANLSYADLINADLRYVNLRNADLSYADLCQANLRNADLSNANLSNAALHDARLNYAIGNQGEVKSIQCETYKVVLYEDIMCIGGETHTLDEWFNFSDDEVLTMDEAKALPFWKKWKPILMLITEYNGE